VYQVPAEVAMSMIHAFLEVFPGAVLLSGSGQELILMGVNGARPELDPDAVRTRLAAAPAVQADLDRLSLGTLLELVGTFVASADALGPVVQPYPAVTDDNPLMEHGLLSPRSQLKNHGMPLSLVKVETVPAWCPKCFPGGRPIAGLETLPAYTAVMWRDPGVVARDERSRAVVGANSYLRALFSTATATSR
jgi:hypothetical protein